MDTVKHISFFAEVDETVMGEICLSLKTLIFLPNDMILFKGDVGKELFIVAKGVVEVVRDDLPAEKRKNASPILLRSGSFFGEIALIMEVRRTCSVQAKTVCEINILLQRTFDDILREHPDFAKRMNELVVARQLETSLARSDGGGSMKIRQADLNYANKRVEQTMMTGLRQRASGQGTMLRKGSISKKVFPNFVEDQEMDGNPAKDEVADTPPNRKSIRRGDSFIAKGMGEWVERSEHTRMRSLGRRASVREHKRRRLLARERARAKRAQAEEVVGARACASTSGGGCWRASVREHKRRRLLARERARAQAKEGVGARAWVVCVGRWRAARAKRAQAKEVVCVGRWHASVGCLRRS
jgi:CRP-like cAMP-binding protein